MEGKSNTYNYLIITALGVHVIGAILFILAMISVLYVSDLHTQLTKIIDSRLLLLFYVFLGCWFSTIFIKSFLDLYEKHLKIKHRTLIDERLVYFIKNTYIYIIFIIGVFVLLSASISVIPLLATGGFLAVVVGLASQKILGDIFSGTIIAADQPFREGDRVMINEILGDVVAIGPWSVRIKTLDNKLMIIPNNVITGNIMTNYVLPDYRLSIRIKIRVAYGSDLDHVKWVLLRVAYDAAEAGMVLRDPAPSVYFLEFGESSMNFLLDVNAKRYDVIWTVTDQINSRIYSAFLKEGIEIPFPQMDIHMGKKL